MELEQSVLEMIAAIETEVKDLEYGTMQVSLVLVNSQPQLSTLTIAKSKRVKYPQNSKDNTSDGQPEQPDSM